MLCTNHINLLAKMSPLFPLIFFVYFIFETNFKVMEGKISSCDECFLHADIQTNVTFNRYQTKVDILFSNIHGYPHNGMFDSVPFIRLKGIGMKSKRI